MRRRWSGVAGAVLVVALAILLLSIVTDEFPDEMLGDQTQAIISFVRHHGEAAAVGLLYLEESGVPMPVPGDGFVMFLGHRVARSIVPAILICLTISAAVVLGASNLYFLSHRFGRRLVQGRTGRVFHITPRRLTRVEGWFARWGPWALIFGRHIPGFRVPITVAAGVFGVRYRVFVASVAISTITWSAFFLAVGHALGGRVGDFVAIHRHATGVTMVVVVAALVAYVAVRLVQVGGLDLTRRRRGVDPADDRSSPP